MLQRGVVQHGVVSIGNFDGVHKGHQALLTQSGVLASNACGSPSGVPVIAVTFDPHPAALLRPETVPIPIASMQTRADRMSRLGVEALVVCRTTPELLRLSPQDFFQRLIMEELHALGVVEGPNFFFGNNRAGDTKLLSELCVAHSVEFQIAQSTSHDGMMISSSRLRTQLIEGDVAGFATLCGHHHRIEGVVEKGEQRGRTLGFPTANLGEIKVAVPANGVYAGFAILGDSRYRAAIHLGPNPTFEEKKGGKVEIHLIDYDGDLYGRTLAVEFVDRVRKIAKFDSVDELTDQLRRDVQWVRKRTALAAT